MGGPGDATSGNHGFPMGIPWYLWLPLFIATSPDFVPGCRLCGKQQGCSANRCHNFHEVVGRVAGALGDFDSLPLESVGELMNMKSDR